MDASDFEGSLVLEKMAEIGQLDAFYDAVDSDNFSKVRSLMLKAGLDLQTIEQVVIQMQTASGSN